MINSTCRPCDCNGNVNQDESGWCDSRTGRCLRCLHNTAGSRCEKCADGFFGDAFNKECNECRCDPVGSLNSTCDPLGQCYCKSNYEGEKCDRCKSGRGDLRAGCPLCNCLEVGSLGSECSSEDGSCTCRDNYDGKRCDRCKSDSYRSAAECLKCECSERGARNQSCTDSAVCFCKDGVQGAKCDSCARNMKWSDDNTGCKPCNCNTLGSTRAQCDQETGECSCKRNVDSSTGCSRCLPGYYNLNRDGCIGKLILLFSSSFVLFYFIARVRVFLTEF